MKSKLELLNSYTAVLASVHWSAEESCKPLRWQVCLCITCLHTHTSQEFHPYMVVLYVTMSNKNCLHLMIEFSLCWYIYLYLLYTACCLLLHLWPMTASKSTVIKHGPFHLKKTWPSRSLHVINAPTATVLLLKLQCVHGGTTSYLMDLGQKRSMQMLLITGTTRLK